MDERVARGAIDEPLLAFERPGEVWMDLLREAEEPRKLGRLGPFEIVEVLRGGAQGLVFRGRQPGTGRDVALKRMATGIASTPVEVRRFEREIEAVSTLSHPGIVTTHGVEQLDGVPLLVMEWVDGVPLTQWAAGVPAGRTGVRTKLAAFLQLCDAVQHAHSSGVLHRDLKPSNILMDTDGRVRVLDFGLARRLEGELKDATRTLGFVGTPAYAAPERFTEGAAPIDVRGDVFSLGVLLYEMLAGARPFGGGSLRELMEAVEGGNPPRLRGRAGVDVQLDTMVRKALSPRVEDRYQTVHAFAEDVRRYLAGRPVLAMPPSALYVAATWIRSHRVAFGFSVALLVVVAVAAIGGYRQASVIAAERDLAKEAAEAARREAEKAQKVQDFYTYALFKGTSELFLAGSTDVFSVLEYVAENAESDLKEYPHIVVEILTRMAGLYSLHQRHDDAHRIAEQGLLVQETLEDGDPQTTAALLSTVSKTLLDAGELEESLDLELRIKGIHESLPQPHPSPGLYAANRGVIAGLLTRLGRLDEAEAAWREAIELQKNVVEMNEARRRVPYIYRAGLGSVLVAREDYEEAEPLLFDLLEEVEERFGPNDITVADVCGKIGQLFDGDSPEDAVEFYARSLGIFRRLYPAGNRRVGQTMLGLGRGLVKLGRAAEARELFEGVLKMKVNEDLKEQVRRELRELESPEGGR